MKTQNTFSISFFLKKDKAKDGIAPLYVRITVNGAFADLATKRKVKISNWNQKEQKLLGKHADDVSTREKIRLLSNDINTAYDDLRREKQILTADAVKSKAEGLEIKPYTLNFLLNYHNVELKQLIEEGTLKNYRTTERLLQEFLIKKRKKKDIYLAQLDNVFIIDFGMFMLNRTPNKGQRPCTNNTVMKHMERFKKMIGIALKNNWMSGNPFQHFERKIIQKDRDCLEMEELERLRNVTLEKRGHIIVRDMCLFSCITGLAYADIVRLTKEYIIRDSDGEYWIEMCRKKTKNFTERKFNVLLLPEALQLMDKYVNDPVSLENGTIFPVYSNQVVNRYLKIVAKKANIKKRVTFHLARHTFATTVTLENGVPMESVSHMLGHASIRTTQIYSKVKKKKVLADMSTLREKINPQLRKAI
jgi:integrase/recombinase XerD